ncbi:MAG: nucleotide exchange factor GrpE [Proteobacteria bacterium]|nr:nucleotide exchange factor GrpE [Pseudomonadota bacterium]
MTDAKDILMEEAVPAAEVVADAAALEVERDGWKDKAYRAAAEAENVRKRAATDVLEARQYAVASFAREMLGVADNLVRALAAPEGNEKALRDGVVLTAANLQQILERFGVKKIAVKAGEALNPEHHQVMLEVPSHDIAAGKIVAELQAGFTLHGRLLRASMVSVAKAPEAQA